MLSIFSDIKLVGFDLDSTLYQNNPKIDERISLEIAKKVLEYKPELLNLGNAKRLCDNLYAEVGSRTQSLRNLSFPNAGEMINECISRADITDLIKPDDKIAKLLDKIHENYKTFLITSAITNQAIPRLKKLGIEEKVFDYAIFGDSALPNKKLDGSIFSYFLNMSGYSAQEHVYIGDNLKTDILPPRSLGMKTIAVGKNLKEADFSVERIYDIENLLL